MWVERLGKTVTVLPPGVISIGLRRFPCLRIYERTLKAQGIRAFPQVFSRLKPQVAAL